MGIQGLLPLLAEVTKRTHVSSFAGQTFGVDISCWLHAGATRCATQLALGQPTRGYVDFVLDRIACLRHNKVSPYVVFDGQSLPAKAGTNTARSARRAEAKALGEALLRKGDHAGAKDAFKRAVSITSTMVRHVQHALKAAGIPFVVAPFEADAQLAWLQISGVVDAVLTEDSDLLVFGVTSMVCKMTYAGDCSHVDLSPGALARVTALKLATFDHKLFRAMCILSGCDYLPSIRGIGLKTANSLLVKWRSVEKIQVVLRAERGACAIPPGYADAYADAEWTFLHQPVFDVNAHDATPELIAARATVAGALSEPAIAVALCTGELDPKTLQPWPAPLPRLPSRGPRRSHSLPSHEAFASAEGWRDKTQPTIFQAVQRMRPAQAKAGAELPPVQRTIFSSAAKRRAPREEPLPNPRPTKAAKPLQPSSEPVTPPRKSLQSLADSRGLLTNSAIHPGHVAVAPTSPTSPRLLGAVASRFEFGDDCANQPWPGKAAAKSKGKDKTKTKTKKKKKKSKRRSDKAAHPGHAITIPDSPLVNSARVASYVAAAKTAPTTSISLLSLDAFAFGVSSPTPTPTTPSVEAAAAVSPRTPSAAIGVCRLRRRQLSAVLSRTVSAPPAMRRQHLPSPIAPSSAHTAPNPAPAPAPAPAHTRDDVDALVSAAASAATPASHQPSLLDSLRFNASGGISPRTSSLVGIE
ncbi:uncharacterized protein AMSG_06449 [Thecamonas trahens ATCC 50062]|uniref:Uncharacterized protein n=1 Tax=Thecamonas trahens ATCC 50062 TaxID=461836 RepID=A0A0L0DFN4_THETB|nr:hypothetical protein AMSG_06449 [Thecamonas trahens ATCC 50062]KNC51104.1 hypothetical protein AMSG_06449 [Thecamonas trahens ATCC 50062]|eukprot:XP_013756312.1 hypothetical protein AMSG_06449 [Thecamonas trahens ATCC 50062]